MAGELTKNRKKQIARTVASHDIDLLIKPLTREIHLFDTFIAGTSHLQEPDIISGLKVNERLILQRENNKFDSNAIMILTENRKRIGYVPEKDNIIFSRLMDAGKLLSARITKISPRGGYTMIAIGIYLIDF